jgi:hypothetical protein
MGPSIPQPAEALTRLFHRPWLGTGEPPTRAAVLGWVNHARRAIDLPPLHQLPKGIPQDVGRCPLAEAVPGLEVHSAYGVAASPQARWLAGAWGAELRPDGRFKLPPPLAAFVHAFDAGFYPELVER